MVEPETLDLLSEVTALDTNVLVRFLVEDDLSQHRRAVRLIENATRDETVLLVTGIVLCERVW